MTHNAEGTRTQAHAAYKSLHTSHASADKDEAKNALAERDALILAELPQVHFIASRILERLPTSVQLEDLVNAGVLGLLEAYSHYDSHHNVQFKTFARFRIRGAILDSLRSLDWGSRGMRRKAREIAQSAARLEGVLGRKPEKREIAAEMRITLDQLETAMTQLDSLQVEGQRSGPANEAGDLPDLIETAPSREESPFELCFRAEQKEQLAEAIATLSEREQLLLSLYYKEELTMKEVAEVIGIALSRVSQIHAAALGKLRVALAARENRPVLGACMGRMAPGVSVPTALPVELSASGQPRGARQAGALAR